MHEYWSLKVDFHTTDFVAIIVTFDFHPTDRGDAHN